MLKIWGKIIKNNKIVMHTTQVSEIDGNYQDRLKDCIDKICEVLDISHPYWLSSNVNEYNRRRKTVFNQDNFVDTINFDKFTIEEIKEE